MAVIIIGTIGGGGGGFIESIKETIALPELITVLEPSGAVPEAVTYPTITAANENTLTLILF